SREALTLPLLRNGPLPLPLRSAVELALGASRGQSKAMIRIGGRPLIRPWTSTVRISVSVLVGLAVHIALRQAWPVSLSTILAWDAGVLCYLILTYQVIRDHSIESIRRRAARLDTRTWVMTMLVILAACASLFGLGVSLHGPDKALPNNP